MRFGKNLRLQAIPQWRECYLDYQHLKMFVIFIKKIVELVQRSDDLYKAAHTNSSEDEPLSEAIDFTDRENIVLIITELKGLAENANQMFFMAHKKGMDINRLFVQMKFLEVTNNYQKCLTINKMPLGNAQRGLLLNLIESVYIEAIYTENMLQANLEGERKIIKKHKKYAENFVETPNKRNRKFKRLEKGLVRQIEQIEDTYAKIGEGPSKKNRQHLRELAKKIEPQSSDSLIAGIWLGIVLTVIIILIIILVYSRKSVETDPVFNRDFPTWRGIAIFIFYIWIIGFDVYEFEKNSISHRTVFEFTDHHYSTSTDIFKLAGFFSTFFIIMFTIYTLEIAEVAKLENIGSEYMVLFVWGVLLLYLFNPLPIFHFRSRIFGFKLVIKSILSPIIGVTFPVVWTTDQFVSLITPFKDFAYTICYYQNIDFKSPVDQGSKKCNSSSNIEVVFLVGAVVYIYRILQCIKQGYDKKSYFCQPQFFNTIKYSSSLATLTCSYFWKAGANKVFAAWLFFAIFSTIYSYIWDLKMDWALLQKNSPHFLLRKYLTFQPFQLYYVIMALNLIFRLVWIATLSPSITSKTFGSPQIFSLVTGFIQILRRGIWNLLRVQKEHLANCGNFMAVPDTSKKTEAQIFESLKKKNQNSVKFNEVSQQRLLNNHEQFEQKFEKQNLIKNNFMVIIRETMAEDFEEKRERLKKLKKLQKKFSEFQEQIEQLEKKYNLYKPVK